MHPNPAPVRRQSSIGRCSLSLFSARNGQGGALALREIDAMHFDMERTDNRTPFHPTFHVQRDTDNGLGDDAVHEVVAAIPRADSAQISLERSEGLGTSAAALGRRQALQRFICYSAACDSTNRAILKTPTSPSRIMMSNGGS